MHSHILDGNVCKVCNGEDFDIELNAQYSGVYYWQIVDKGAVRGSGKISVLPR
jgi:hypothetical protein